MVPPADVAGPDELYADAAAKTAMYARLSRNAAAAGDSQLAVSAAWAADIHAVQALLWERARDSDAEPYERFFAVGTAVGAALDPADAPPGTGEKPRTARGVIVAARRQLLGAFDPPAALLISARLIAVDHLAALPAPGPQVPAQAGSLASRLSGSDVVAAVEELWTAAADCRVVARAFAAEGLGRDAVRQAQLGEIAAFEAYLLDSSLAVGDTELLCADLRRAALADMLPSAGLLPEDVPAARALVREAMTTVLGPAEADRLHLRLAVLDERDPEIAGSGSGADSAGRDSAGRDSAGRDSAGRDRAGRDSAGLGIDRDAAPGGAP